MQNYKKVRDYLRDRKMSLFEKEKQQVVVSGGEIVWLVNDTNPTSVSGVTGQTRLVLLLQVREERSEETSNDLIP